MAFVGVLAKAIPALCQHGGSALETRETEQTSLYRASHVERVVAKYKSVQNSDEDTVDEDALEEEQITRRELVYYQDRDGMWIIHAKLPPEAGALLVKAIEAVATPVQVERQKDLRESLQSTPTPNSTPIPDGVSAETFSDAVAEERSSRFENLLQHTRADALVSIAEHFLANADQKTQWQRLKGSERCQVVLHVDVNTLRNEASSSSPAHQHCNLDEKHWISPNTAKRLSCDASLITVLEDDKGKVLNIGRRARTVPPSISRALSLRDRTCRFPGCCESRYVDAHHIRHWADGGETSLNNLVTLCRHHHRLLHSGGFSIAVRKQDAKQQLVFSTPSGKFLEQSIYPQFPGVSAETFQERMRDAVPEIGPRTCVPDWHGEDCDYGMAVDALLQRDDVARLRGDVSVVSHPI